MCYMNDHNDDLLGNGVTNHMCICACIILATAFSKVAVSVIALYNNDLNVFYIIWTKSEWFAIKLQS